MCRQCGCHGHIEHWHVSKEGRARPMPSRWWASSMYALIDTLKVGTICLADDDDDDDDDDDVSPRTSSLVHRITIALRPEWSEPPHGGNWSEPSYRGNWSVPPGSWSEPPHGGNWSEPSYGGNWSETPHGGNWSEPSYGGNWSKPHFGGNWSTEATGLSPITVVTGPMAAIGPRPTFKLEGNWSEPSYGGNCGNWSEPHFGGNWSEPHYMEATGPSKITVVTGPMAAICPRPTFSYWSQLSINGMMAPGVTESVALS